MTKTEEAKIGGKIHKITNETLTRKLSRIEYVELVDLIAAFSKAVAEHRRAADEYAIKRLLRGYKEKYPDAEWSEAIGIVAGHYGAVRNFTK